MSASRVVEQLKTENLRKSRNIWKRFEIGWGKRLVPMVPVSLPEINSGNSGQKFSNSRYQHCVKSVQIRSFFWSVFSRIRTEYGPEKTPYLDTFDAMQNLLFLSNYAWILKFPIGTIDGGSHQSEPPLSFQWDWNLKLRPTNWKSVVMITSTNFL